MSPTVRRSGLLAFAEISVWAYMKHSLTDDAGYTGCIRNASKYLPLFRWNMYDLLCSHRISLDEDTPLTVYVNEQMAMRLVGYESTPRYAKGYVLRLVSGGCRALCEVVLPDIDWLNSDCTLLGFLVSALLTNQITPRLLASIFMTISFGLLVLE